MNFFYLKMPQNSHVFYTQSFSIILHYLALYYSHLHAGLGETFVLFH